MTFFDEAFNKIKILKPNIKDSTIQSYLMNIKKVSLELFKSDTPSINYFRDFNSIKEYTLKMKSLASQKNMITAILVLTKAYLDMGFPLEIITLYNDYHKELSKKQEESYLDNVKTEREENNWVSRDDISLKIQSIASEIMNWKSKGSQRKLVDKCQQLLVLNLYYLLPPLRNDYAIVKVVNDPDFECEKEEDKIDKTFNYINLSTKKLLLCKYKTDRYYGIKKIDIPEELFDIIVDWEIVKSEHYKDTLPHNFLLLNTTNMTPMKHNTLTKYINKIFYPKKVSTTLLRKIYLSEKYPVVTTYREQLLDSHIMGHSVGTQKMIYSKKNS
jgi:hypothetical protein